MYWLLCLLHACWAAEISLGKVESLTVKVSIARKVEEQPYRNPENEGEMKLTRDLEVKPIEQLSSGKFKLCVDGCPNSLEIIDSKKDILEEISTQIQASRIEIVPVEASPETFRTRRLSRQFSSELKVGAEPSTLSPGTVRSLSQKISLPITLEDPSEKEENKAPLNSVRSSENFAELQQRFKKIPKMKPLDGALERSKSREGGLSSVRKADNFEERKAAFEPPPKRFSSQKIALTTALAEKKDEVAVPVTSTEKKTSSTSPLAEKKTTATTPTVARKDKEVVDRTLSRQISKDTFRSQNSRDSLKKETKQPSKPEIKPVPIPVNSSSALKETPSPTPIDLDIKSRIATFSPNKRKLKEAEKMKHAEDLKTVPRRKIRDNPFLQQMKMQNNSPGYRGSEGIGKDELEARKQMYRKQRPQKNELDGKSGLTRRNSSLFTEYRKQRPSMSESSYSGSFSMSSTEEETSEGTFEDYGGECSNDGSGSAQDQSPSEMFKVRLCLPENTSASHYYSLFQKAIKEGIKAENHILDLAGTQVKSTLSILERILLTQMRKSGKNVADGSESSEVSDRVKTYAWKGQDTVDLIEQRLGGGSRIMFQVFHNGDFDGLNSDERVFACLPAAVGRSAALNEVARPRYAAFNYNNENSAVLITGASEVNTLVEWAEYELQLPTWTGLKGEFEDGETVEFGQNFSIGVDLPNRMIDVSADQLLDFFALQYKKALLDAVYAGYEAVVLVLPPQFQMIKIAQEAIGMALMAAEYYLPSNLTIHIPEAFN